MHSSHKRGKRKKEHQKLSLSILFYYTQLPRNRVASKISFKHLSSIEGDARHNSGRTALTIAWKVKYKKKILVIFQKTVRLLDN